MIDVIIEETLPNALMIGVDYDLFWTLNPKSLSPFIKAFNLKQEYDDSMAWRQGAYIKMAIASALDKRTKYPNKPFADKGKEVNMTPQQIKEKMMATAEIINKKLGEEVELDG